MTITAQLTHSRIHYVSQHLPMVMSNKLLNFGIIYILTDERNQNKINLMPDGCGAVDGIRAY